MESLKNDCFEYMSLLYEHKSKCYKVMHDGLKQIYNSFSETLRMEHVDERWLELLLKWFDASGIEQKYLPGHYTSCKNEKMKTLLDQYGKGK